MREIASSVTVEVPAELVVEAAARLYQMAEYEMVDSTGAPASHTGNAAQDAACRLLAAASGHDLSKQPSDVFWQEPLVVEAHARAYERIADMFERFNYRAKVRDLRAHGDVLRV